MSKQKIQQGRNWYVIHTYPGEEEAVARNLQQRIENLDMEDKIFSVIVPKEKKIKIRNGKRKVIEERIYPGYIFVEMIVTDESWYVVRNTPRVTGFIGAGTTPIAVSAKEIETLKKRTGVETPQYKIDVTPGSLVKIVDGPFKSFEGKISEIDTERGKLKVLVNVFGRDTPIEVDSLQVKKI